MKRIVSAILIFILCIGLSGCYGNNEKEIAEDPPNSEGRYWEGYEDGYAAAKEEYKGKLDSVENSVSQVQGMVEGIEDGDFDWSDVYIELEEVLEYIHNN